MTEQEINFLAMVLGEAGVIVLLFYCWQAERRDRIQTQREYIDVLRERKTSTETSFTSNS